MQPTTDMLVARLGRGAAVVLRSVCILVSRVTRQLIGRAQCKQAPLQQPPSLDVIRLPVIGASPRRPAGRRYQTVPWTATIPVSVARRHRSIATQPRVLKFLHRSAMTWSPIQLNSMAPWPQYPSCPPASVLAGQFTTTPGAGTTVTTPYKLMRTRSSIQA
jgi:hypothetical protein